jgi:hypothetical protein
MPDDLFVGYIIALLSMVVGFVLNEIHYWYKDGKKTIQKENKIAKILFTDINAIIDSLHSYTHECHRPEYDENLEMVCIARNAQGILMKNILADFQTICNDPTIFDNPTFQAVFNLKLFLSEFIDRCDEVIEYDEFWTTEMRIRGVTNLDDIEDETVRQELTESREYRFEDLNHRFVRDFNLVHDKSYELKDVLITKYNFKDSEE